MDRDQAEAALEAANGRVNQARTAFLAARDLQEVLQNSLDKEKEREADARNALLNALREQSTDRSG